MCRGDISLVTFNWVSSTRLPLADFSPPHECVNFEKINQWSREHAVDALEPGLLHHPVLGKSKLSFLKEVLTSSRRLVPSECLE